MVLSVVLITAEFKPSIVLLDYSMPWASRFGLPVYLTADIYRRRSCTFTAGIKLGVDALKLCLFSVMLIGATFEFSRQSADLQKKTS